MPDPFRFKNKFTVEIWRHGPKPSDPEPTTEPERTVWYARRIAQDFVEREGALLAQSVARANKRAVEKVKQATKAERQWFDKQQERYFPILAALAEADRRGDFTDQNRTRLLEMIRTGKIGQ
jgi:hypothetical protein